MSNEIGADEVCVCVWGGGGRELKDECGNQSGT